ncbi:hypothetical protein, partial [Klebsiella pneumoniae]|uniref:hypothetical protein n=1 Tax=Klebsiella pneumoniae TaxID=573 RepID=UPI003012DC85
MKRLLYLVLFVIVFEPMIIGQSYLPLSGGTITGPFFVSYPSGRIITGDGTNNLVIGSWDGVNNRIESTPGRPM